MLIETQCGRLFVDVRGDGPTICLWHSLLADGGMWDGVVAALARATGS